MTQAKKGLYILHIDGGKKASAAGEKGEGAIGAVLKEPNGFEIEGAVVSRRIGLIPDPHTAEYEALLAGLDLAKDNGVEYLAVFSDSRTLVNQVNDLWDADDHLEDYADKTRSRLDKEFPGWQLSWIPRKWNQIADDQVDAAFDEPVDIERPTD